MRAKRWMGSVALATGVAAASAAPAWAVGVGPIDLGDDDLPTPLSVCDNSIAFADSTMDAPCIQPDPDSLRPGPLQE